MNTYVLLYINIQAYYIIQAKIFLSTSSLPLYSKIFFISFFFSFAQSHLLCVRRQSHIHIRGVACVSTSRTKRICASLFMPTLAYNAIIIIIIMVNDIRQLLTCWYDGVLPLDKCQMCFFFCILPMYVITAAICCLNCGVYNRLEYIVKLFSKYSNRLRMCTVL